ncbi:MAG: hypothetical protein K5761_07510 [Clostridiales bacterium]|nr:hypothetical protein [Clostridiales bacterium]
MKNGSKIFAIVWAIVFASFNLIFFLIPHKYSFSTWISYAFIVVAFLGELGCGTYLFKQNKAGGIFLRVSTLHITYIGTVAMLIVGTIFSRLPDPFAYIGGIVCFLILAFTAVAVIKASVAADIVENIDQKVREKTLFVKSLTVDADSVMARSKSDAVKAEAKRVYEAVRYSDPMSSDALAGVESQITLKFDSFAQSVDDDDYELAKANADELIILINDRNKKCKILK